MNRFLGFEKLGGVPVAELVKPVDKATLIVGDINRLPVHEPVKGVVNTGALVRCLIQVTLGGGLQPVDVAFCDLAAFDGSLSDLLRSPILESRLREHPDDTCDTGILPTVPNVKPRIALVDSRDLRGCHTSESTICVFASFIMSRK